MKELERLRREQTLAREERDGWFKAGREARGEEEQHRADMRGLSDKMEECRRQVAGLRAEQRAVEDELETAEYLYRYAIALLQHCIHGAEYCVHSRKCHSCLLFTLLS